MRNRGPKSAALLACGPVADGSPRRLVPPSYLTGPARAEFIDIVGSCAADHFVVSDTALLASYVETSLLTRDTTDFAQFERAARLLASLATRLRLTPASRTDPKTLTRRLPAVGPFPWDEV